uniref:F-box domain-containing protein n=1 Tax=Ganoderma boninense TaxID=34458 RepID=A0A5K1JZX8_9APHY|nr:F-box domain-containing protein [Ganoderma boninense]
MEDRFEPHPRSHSLDLDVFDNIFACLTDYSDLLSLSLACSSLHPLAIRSLLRNRPVFLENTDTILKFHDFVFANPASRLPHVTALRICIAQNEARPSCRERAIDCLLAILEHAPSLRSLQLLSDGQKLGYLDDPRVFAAVGSLATLRELVVSSRANAGHTNKADFINAVRGAALTKLALRCIHPTDSPEWTPGSFSAALSPFAHSLESLSIMNSHVRLTGALPKSSPTATQFHALRSLTLHCLTCPPDLAVLVQLFPHLDGTLHLTSFGYDDADADPDDDYSSSSSSSIPPFLLAARAHNTATQDTHPSFPRGLTRLVCDAQTLFVLNLRCPIRLTVLPASPPDDDRGPCLVASLRAHPPARLALQYVLGPVGLVGVEYEGLIPPGAAATLTHLTLCIKHEYTRCGDRKPVCAMRWDDLWPYSVLPALQHGLRALTHLRLVFHCEAWSPPSPASSPASSPSSSSAHAILQDGLLADLRPASFPFGAVAAAIADELPALRYCFLTVGAWVGEGCPHRLVERWCAARAWRVVHSGNGSRMDDASVEAEGRDAEPGGATSWGAGRELVELHGDVAEAIIAREDLGVFADDANHAMHWDRSDPFGGMHG